MDEMEFVDVHYGMVLLVMFLCVYFPLMGLYMKNQDECLDAKRIVQEQTAGMGHDGLVRVWEGE